MAMLATLQDANVLPPEGTPEANRIIQMVIQFQALFMKSDDPAVRSFFDQALIARWANQAESFGETFRTRGWSSEILEALSLAFQRLSRQERGQLGVAFSSVNMQLTDFERLGDLFTKAQVTYRGRGQDIHRVFAERRQTMPGGQRGDRKERRNGNQSLYPYQS